MKTVLAALNAKYTHSSLALRYLMQYCQDEFPKIEAVEYNINQQTQQITADLAKRQPDVLGVSCYIWNIELVLAAISDLKKADPRITIVLGGPEVSFDVQFWLNHYPEIDFIIAGEGEDGLLAFLRAFRASGGQLEKADLTHIPGLVYREDQEIKVNPRQNVDLTDVPKVYSGPLDDLENKIVYYETTRGCPFRCAYCLSSVMGKVREFPIEGCKEELRRLADAGVQQVRFVDRTFNYDAKRAYDLLEFMIALDTPTRFQLEISGDILTDPVLELLRKAPPNRLQFEIGVQSTNPETLRKVQRKQDLDRLRTVVKFLGENTNVRVLLDLIAGLPDETFDRFGKSFDYVYSLAPFRIQLGFLKLLRGSRLREEADLFGCVYSERAPYEVVRTDHISYNELARLHLIEDLVSKYVNSHRFDRTLEYLLRDGRSPFSLFNEFASQWEQSGYHWINHSQEGLYKILAEFHLESNPKLHEYLRWDFRINEPRRHTPSWMGGSQGRVWENNLIQTGQIQRLLPELEDIPPREIGRRIFVDKFRFSDTPERYLFYFTPGATTARTFRLE